MPNRYSFSPTYFPAQDLADDMARRTRLLAAARSDRYLTVRRALTQLRAHYRLRLPLIERRWGLGEGWR